MTLFDPSSSSLITKGRRTKRVRSINMPKHRAPTKDKESTKTARESVRKQKKAEGEGKGGTWHLRVARDMYMLEFEPLTSCGAGSTRQSLNLKIWKPNKAKGLADTGRNIYKGILRIISLYRCSNHLRMTYSSIRVLEKKGEAPLTVSAQFTQCENDLFQYRCCSNLLRMLGEIPSYGSNIWFRMRQRLPLTDDQERINLTML